MKKKVILLLVLFFVFSVFGFETKYYFAGHDWPRFHTQSPNHEKISTKSFQLICENREDPLSVDSIDFINENLGSFMDGPLESCDNDEIYELIKSIKMGNGYNDHAEMDGFTATLENNFDKIDNINKACIACLAFGPFGICEIAMPIFGTIGCGIIVAKLNANDFSYSPQADLGNEARYPFMHSQFNGDTLGKNPDIFFKMMDSYLKSYFYELVVLGLTSENTPENKFVSFTDVTQHTSTNPNDFIKTAEYRKILLGEIFHTIEDSFAHNIRYTDENTNGELIFKIGAIINMTTANNTAYYDDFKHDLNFPPIETKETLSTCSNCPTYNDLVDDGVFIWNCKDIDNRGGYREIPGVGFPLDMSVFSDDGPYFTYDSGFMDRSFINMKYASTFASIAVADYLWKIGDAIRTIKGSDFDGNYPEVVEPLINEFLERWFTDGTELFLPQSTDYLSNYPEIKHTGRWENLYNIDYWIESKNEDAFNYKAAYLPWITWKNSEDFEKRWVFKTVENYPSREGYNPNSETSYDAGKKIMTFQKSSMSIMWSWLEGSDDFRETIDFTDEDFLKTFADSTEIKVYTIPEEDSEGKEVSPASIFIPRGFNVCLKYSTDNGDIFPESDNYAARFWKMPTYRCFYGGENGRLIAGGKEDALKPGTEIWAMSIDMDGDGYLDTNDNCFSIVNPDQEDDDGDKLGNPCDKDRDGDGEPNVTDNCPIVYNPVQSDLDHDGVGDACDACPYVEDTIDGRPIAKYSPDIMSMVMGQAAALDGYGLLVPEYYTDTDGESKLIDTDLDGVPDACDNCIYASNPRIGVNHQKEIFVAPCDNPDDDDCEGGMHSMELTKNGGRINNGGVTFILPKINWTTGQYNFKFAKSLLPFYSWQADHDLDGIGDVCDYSGGQYGEDDVHYDPGTSTARIINVKGIDKDNGYNKRINSLFQLDLWSAKTNRAHHQYYKWFEKVSSTVHFCGMPTEEYYDLEGNSRWGQDGFCTIGIATVLAEPWAYPDYTQLLSRTNSAQPVSIDIPFGYSHGTDPAQESNDIQDSKPWTHIAWSNNRNNAENLPEVDKTIQDYRIPIEVPGYNPNAIFGNNCAPTVESSGSICRTFPYWNWRKDALSYMKCDETSNIYMLCNQLERDSAEENNAETFHYTLSAGAKGSSKFHINEFNDYRKINPEYFYNPRKYARSFRNSLIDLKAQTYMTESPKFLFSVFKNFHFSDIPYGTKSIKQWQTVDKNFRITDKTLPENYISVTSGESNMLYAVVAEEGGVKALYVNYPEDVNDWLRAFTILNWPSELEVLGMDIVDGTLYVAGIDKEINPAPFRVYKYDIKLTAMNFVVMHEFAEPMTQVKFVKAGDELMITGINQSALKIYSIKSKKIIEKTALPLRVGYTIETNGEDLYIAGGFDANNNIINDVVVSKDLGITWDVLTEFSDQQIDISTSFIHLSGEKMYIINPAVDTDSSMKKIASIDLITGETLVSRIIPEGISVEVSSDLCIHENSGSIFPGSIGYDGECLPVYDYNYETVSYFDYKKTVVGYNNNLYLGGLTGVRRVEINEDGSLVNSDMLYTGITNNLAIHKNAMYGANYGEIDVYSIDEDGSTSRVKGISSSSCGNVRVYSDRLFTAENKKVRIFDLTDPQNPQLIKTIPTSGKVKDLEVVDSKLYVYEETTSWFTTKGYTGIYDISDLDSYVRTHYFKMRCRDAEMQKSGDVVYLGCKNGQFKATVAGLEELSGEKNYVREGYVYKGSLYQVFSGSLHKSKTASVAAVCGDGIVENGEVCEGNIVECSSIDSSYIGGLAACNSTCDGYNESICESDGW